MDWNNVVTAAKLVKPAFQLGQFVKGFLKGSIDEVAQTFTDAEVAKFQDTADILNGCRPWKNHLKKEAYRKINKALRNKDYQKTREIIILNKQETSAPWCISILKTAVIDVCTKCTTIIKEALPPDIVVPK